MSWRRRTLTLILLILVLVLAAGALAACEAEPEPGPVGPAGPAGPVGPPGPAGENATASQEFVGSETCADCHEEIYARFSLAAHPHALPAVSGDEAPAYPYDSETGGIPGPPEGYTWDDISYIIGGYGWKARFVDQNGYLLTGEEGEATQYNFAYERIDAPAGWVPYHPGETLEFDCARCHTTGYQPRGHQDDLEGIVGTWTFEGIQCERCHGPGSLHAANPQGVQMVVERDSQLCGDCHLYQDPRTIAADDELSFGRHQQQFGELYNTKHFALSCITCHDPHASANFADEELNPNQGIRQACENCHWAQTTSKNERHGAVDCIDCHMPPMNFSAQGDPDLFIADVRSHQFAINPDPNAPQFSEDGSQVMPYITLTFACKQCHNDQFAVERELEELAEMARGYHNPQPSATPTLAPTPTPEGTPEATATTTP